MPVRRSGAGLAALVLVFLGAAGFAAPGAEAAPGRCQPGTGVTVVVDYGPLGRSTGIGCDPGGAGDPASRVVPAAGFPITYAAGQPFVCRIDGLPDAEAEPCNRTPPADAYWGLFWNDGKGGGWVYSSQGVATLEVPAGGSIGWRFQDGSGRDLPRAAPTPPAPASSPSPDPTHEGGGGKPSTSPKPTPTPAQPTQPTQGSASPSPTASASPTPSKKPENEKAGERDRRTDEDEKKSDKKDEASDSPEPTPTAEETASDDATLAAVEATSSTSDGSGSDDGWLLVAAGAAVLVLGGTAGVLAWRRRN